jgi:8-oxo-dGTP pyrophosphatase MutT (NUDIX family)
MKQVTKQETSAGGVVYRKVADGYEFLLGKHSGYHKWVLPKGMVEAGEELIETAEREVLEEVGVKVETQREPLKSIAYTYIADLGEVKAQNPHTEPTIRRVVRYQEAGGGSVTIHKTVTYFLMKCLDDSGVTGWEMQERKWVSYSEGLELLAFESEREVLKEAGRALGASDQN